MAIDWSEAYACLSWRPGSMVSSIIETFGKIDCVVFDFDGGAVGGEAPLLPEEFALLLSHDGGEAEFLGAFLGWLAKFETDAADGPRLVEGEPDGLRARIGGLPAFCFFAAEGVLKGMGWIFGGDFERGEVLEVEPGVEGRTLFGRRRSRRKSGFAHSIPRLLDALCGARASEEE